ncbi:MAG: cysteine--tRNA ligase, partial [Elusimicrobiota bacterium]
AGRFIDDYFEVIDALNDKRAEVYPKVTEFIPQIIAIIKELVDRGHAYAAANGDVYFSVSSLQGYGKLSKRNMEELLAGARVDVSEVKQDPMDFALWKSASSEEQKAKSDSAGVWWDSPWGCGRPGWHIECSAMSTHYLGQPFDIHGGGEDLIFPHHENEIAQSEGAKGKPLARYFLHNGFVTINKEKMSKSLGNFFTLRDIYTKFKPAVVRYYMFTEHYRRSLDFSDESLRAAGSALSRIQEAVSKLLFAVDLPASKIRPDKDGPLSRKVLGHLARDFHTPLAVAAVQEWTGEVFLLLQKTQRPDAADAAARLNDAAYAVKELLGLELSLAAFELSAAVQSLLQEREACRKKKDFKRADEIRGTLKSAHGLLVEDTPYGPRLKRD